MYAVAFDFEISKLKEHYHPIHYRRAYYEIKELLYDYGFTWIQGSTYITNNEDLANITFLMTDISEIEWMAKSLRDIRVFEIRKWSNYTDFVKRKYN